MSRLEIKHCEKCGNDYQTIDGKHVSGIGKICEEKGTQNNPPAFTPEKVEYILERFTNPDDRDFTLALNSEKIAKAYLAKCEENARLREALEEISKIADNSEGILEMANEALKGTE